MIMSQNLLNFPTLVKYRSCGKSSCPVNHLAHGGHEERAPNYVPAGFAVVAFIYASRTEVNTYDNLMCCICDSRFNKSALFCKETIRNCIA